MDSEQQHNKLNTGCWMLVTECWLLEMVVSHGEDLKIGYCLHDSFIQAGVFNIGYFGFVV